MSEIFSLFELESEVFDFMKKNGIEQLPEQIIWDAGFQRFADRAGKTKKDGSYSAHSYPVPCVYFNNFKDIEGVWRRGGHVDESARKQIMEMIARDRAEYQRMRENERAAAAQWIRSSFSNLPPASPEHPYLKKKEITRTYGVRQTSDGVLVIPIYAPDGTLVSAQYIWENGQKRFVPRARTAGCFFSVGSDDSEYITISEGYAKSVILFEQTGKKSYVAFSSGNLLNVVEHLRRVYGPTQKIVVVADHDQSGAGQDAAAKCAEKFGTYTALPPQIGQDIDDYWRAGGDVAKLVNDSMVLPDSNRMPFCLSANELAERFLEPKEWLVKGLLPAFGLGMIHGAPKSGKTFFISSIMHALATGQRTWAGRQLSPGRVYYLAGEGLQGFIARGLAWQKFNNINDFGDLNVVTQSFDLNTDAGEAKLVENIDELGVPKLIVIDTLNRFFLGEENSAKESKTMIDVCTRLMNKFKCLVVLIHHTGVGENAQKRARGSSAWAGALDFEISVETTAENTIKIEMLRAKDMALAEPIFGKISPYVLENTPKPGDPPIETAVFSLAAGPPTKQERKISEAQANFQEAWLAQHGGGTLSMNSRPCMSRHSLQNWLVFEKKLSEAAAKKELQPGSDRLISTLIKANKIKAVGEGWEVVDQEWDQALKENRMLMKL